MERLTRAAAEVLGQEVRDVVPLARRKPDGIVFVVGGFMVFAASVFLHEFGYLPGPRMASYVPGLTAMVLGQMFAVDPVFAVLTPAGIQVTASSRVSPRPASPVLGSLDPGVVTGPTGLFGNVYSIGGRRHQVALPHKRRFEQMLAAAR